MNLLNILLFTGIILIFVSYKFQCPPNTVEYRYIRNNLDEFYKDSKESTESAYDVISNRESSNIWLETNVNKKLK